MRHFSINEADVAVPRDLAHGLRHAANYPDHFTDELLRLVCGISTAVHPRDALAVLADVCDSLFHWDAWAAGFYDEREDMYLPILSYDEMNGRRQEELSERSALPLSRTQRRVMEEGPQMYLFESDQQFANPGFRNFGDSTRLSESLMFAPIRNGARVLGIMSVQTYRRFAYDENDLRLLSVLSLTCGAALERIMSESALRREKEVASVFANLGLELSHAETAREAAAVILNATERLVGWDACYFNTYSQSEDRIHRVLSMDIIDGARREVPGTDDRLAPNPFLRKVIDGEPVLILRDRDAPVEESPMGRFGDTSRASLSLIYVPMRSGQQTIGFFTIQSYRERAYGQTDVATIQSLADHCGAAFSRIMAGEALVSAHRELESRIKERTCELHTAVEKLSGEMAERRHAEDELQRAHAVYRQVIENSEGVPYRLCYRTRRYEFIGQGVEAILGLPHDDATADKAGALIQRIEILDPEAPEGIEAYREAFRQGRLSRYRVDMLLRHPGGRMKWVSDCSVPIFDENGSVVGSLGILNDITVRKEAEEREREERESQLEDLRQENSILRRHIRSAEVENPEAFEGVVTHSRTMGLLFRYIEGIGRSDRAILITGETGVGKEMLPPIIHKLSGRPGRFIGVNIASLDNLSFSDTLFGHKRGAFTDAIDEREGLVAAATEGTLFFDEIGDLDRQSQIKLLRLLQTGDYFPLGSDQPSVCRARIICATNRDLGRLVEEGLFRQDLYFRLRTHHLHLPPLRERPEDIEPLTRHFIRKAAQVLGRTAPTPPPELFTLLKSYAFPGNIRELEAMVCDAVGLHRRGILSMKPFEEYINCSQVPGGRDHASREGLTPGEKLLSPGEAAWRVIEEALARTGGNQRQAARLLGITQQSLNRRVRMHAQKARQ